jgi:CDP-glycerol glycerophosphotransferase (TagB/SpsB family)
LQNEAIKRGHDVRWLLLADADSALLRPDDVAVADTAEAVAFNPHAVFAPGNRLPSFIPGIKVQLYHGISDRKRGYPTTVESLFDLFCVEGPVRYGPLIAAQEKRNHYRVRQTGWVKMDELLSYTSPDTGKHKPHILLASTFTPSLSAALPIYQEVKRLAATAEWQWLVTLHPKMAAETVDMYRQLVGPNLEFFETDSVVEALHKADVMVSDNSSILEEFLLLQKPVVTFRNAAPLACTIDIQEPAELEQAIRTALNPDADMAARINAYGPSISAFLDGKAAGRILDEVDDMLNSGWKNRKPLNLFRNWKMRRQLNYYRFW